MAGVWRSDGWGLILHVHGAVAEVYETAGESCLLAGDTTTRGIGETVTLVDGRLLMRDGDRVVWFDAVADLPVGCGVPVDTTTAGIVALVTATVREQYHRPIADDFGTGVVGADPGTAIRTLLGPLADPQVVLLDDTGTWTGVVDPNRTALLDALRAGTHPAGAGSDGDDGLITADLGDGVHYLAPLRLARFAASSERSQVVLAAVLDRTIAGARGVVIDLRTTTAGAETEALLVATRFVPTTSVVAVKEARRPDGSWAPAGELVVRPLPGGTFSGPVVVLIGPATAGPAEALVLALRDLPFVTLVGEPTAGSPGRPLARLLPNGWTLGVPNLDVITADGIRWAGRPIVPDVLVPFVADDIAAGQDPGLDRAREIAGG